MERLDPIRRVDGFLPIADHGLIGDGAGSALVGRDGAVSWLCVPRFDSPPLFASILDPERGGSFLVAPEGVHASQQRYVGETGVLVTEMENGSGRLRVTDALTLRSGGDLSEDAAAGRGELVRVAEVLHGPVWVRVDVVPHGGAEVLGSGHDLRLRCRARPAQDFALNSTLPLDGLSTTRRLGRGERFSLVLRWGQALQRHARGAGPEEGLRETQSTWERWTAKIRYEGPAPDLVRRSAITLKLLDHFQNGAIVAAPTSSLPESVGGERNWDYRYSWIRDAAYSVYALRRIGLRHEAAGFLAWVLDAVERHGRPRVLYDLDGGDVPEEREDDGLRGYRDSRPVRWGNGAREQRQHDVFGEILDCAWQWLAGGGRIDQTLWAQLRSLVEAAEDEWPTPDHGIWEVRTTGRVFTYSAALCQVALDRGARLAERLGFAGDVGGWRAAAEKIRQAILERAWQEEAGAITEHLDGGVGLDASVLALPLRRVVPADHPRMVRTTRAVAERLGAGNGLLYRYLPHESPDGLSGGEGAFLLCSFWLADNLALQGRLDEAAELYESLCSRANGLGLLPEQIDPGDGSFLGNFPQAISHVGLISTGVNLARRLAERAGG